MSSFFCSFFFCMFHIIYGICYHDCCCCRIVVRRHHHRCHHFDRYSIDIRLMDWTLVTFDTSNRCWFHVCYVRLSLTRTYIIATYQTENSISFHLPSSVSFIFKWPFVCGAPRHQATHKIHVIWHWCEIKKGFVFNSFAYISMLNQSTSLISHEELFLSCSTCVFYHFSSFFLFSFFDVIFFLNFFINKHPFFMISWVIWFCVFVWFIFSFSLIQILRNIDLLLSWFFFRHFFF